MQRVADRELTGIDEPDDVACVSNVDRLAVLALVPDRSPVMRLVGFVAGFVAAWIGYVVRAGFLPDSARRPCGGLVLVLLSASASPRSAPDRLPLWTTLLGTAALAGAYEYTYAAAPPEFISTSVTTATTLLFNVGRRLPRRPRSPRARRATPPRRAPRARAPRPRRDATRQRSTTHDGEDQVSHRLSVPLRIAAVAAASAIAARSAATPAYAADGDVEVVNTETVQVYTAATGEVQTRGSTSSSR